MEDKGEGDAESLVVMDMGGSVLGLGAGAANSGAGGTGTAAGAAAAGVGGGTGSEVHAPGAYRSICVELRLHHLAVNAIDKVWGSVGKCGARGEGPGE